MGMINLYSGNNEGLEMILAGYRSPYIAEILQKTLNPTDEIIFRQSQILNNKKILEYLLLDENFNQSFNLNRVINFLRYKDEDFKNINSQLEQYKNNYFQLIKEIQQDNYQTKENEIGELVEKNKAKK